MLGFSPSYALNPESRAKRPNKFPVADVKALITRVSPANPKPPTKLPRRGSSVSYLCPGSRGLQSHLQIRRTKSRSREMPWVLLDKAPVASEWLRASCLRLDPVCTRACVRECVWREEGTARGLERPRDGGGWVSHRDRKRAVCVCQCSCVCGCSSQGAGTRRCALLYAEVKWGSSRAPRAV